MDGKSSDLRLRTRLLASRVIKVVDALPKGRAADVIARQLVRSGTSVGANYREAARATTPRQFSYACDVAIREADETMYWLEVIVDSNLLLRNRLADLMEELDEIIAMLTASSRTSKRNAATKKRSKKAT